MGAPFADRWRLTLPLLVPALGGIAYLFAFGAPARLIVINAGALAAATLWVIWGRLPSGREARLGLAVAAAGLLFVPLLTGPAPGGVARWLPAGPMMLHSGALLLPLITVLAAGAGRWAAAMLGLATAALSLQPDAGALAGLAAVSVVLAVAGRNLALAVVAAAAIILSVLTFGAGTLEPQLYTEGVLAQVWHAAPWAALALGTVLFVVTPALMMFTPAVPRVQATALAALLTGLAAMAVIAPFPFPLIGYGAAPILGFGIALGCLRACPPTEQIRPASA